ncbi:asparagine synthase (glutamine-hydrolyzing) [Pseudochelatococcus lubricantis]|uniref:asparagine synthase (glutamine-hydrolyzing) n=1 Tax=Pseudochelatococcus lubricantis TaxID=1538102 RepID=UPI0035EDF153
MCGIVGCFADRAFLRNGSDVLARMVEAIGHRGPDSAGVSLGERAALGHARLAIIGLADGAQPMAMDEPPLWISFNGEIFNHVELREELTARGHRFRTASDTEVILHLYAETGADCVNRLNGDFAFALWDARRQRMMLARDRMGVRPLFYTWHNGALLFASEIKALLQVPGTSVGIDQVALDQIFTLWAPIPPRTPFRDILELPPAHVMLIDGDGMRIRRYWQLAFPDRDEQPDTRSEADLAREARALLDDATRIRLRADVPVGSYLSGGLDSAIVSTLAARHAAAGLRTFSITFASAEHDESAQQAEMVRALGSRHSAVSCDEADIAAVFPEVVWHTERPVIRTAPAPMYLLSRLVRNEGYKVVLTGEGADEVFAGYDIFKEAAVRRFCARQPSSTRRTKLLGRLYPYLHGLQQLNAETRAACFGIGSDALDDPLFSHRLRLRSTAGAKMFFSADLRDALAGYDATEEMASLLPRDFRRWHPLHQAQYIEATWLLPGYILSSQGDRMAMAHGVEGRFPFLDHRVVEFAARVPPGLQLRTLREKHLLRLAAADLLPPAIAARPKQPYRAPDSRSFAGPSTPDYVAEMLSPRYVREVGLFNPASVERLAVKSQNLQTQGFRDNAAFVGILSTQLWHAIFTGATSKPGSIGHADTRRTDPRVHRREFPLWRHSA